MTGIRAALYALLAAQEAFTGTVTPFAPGPLGTAEDAAIYPHGAPFGVQAEHIVYKRADAPGERSLAAQGRGPQAIRFATFDFEVWGNDSDRVEVLVEALRSCLESARGEYDQASIRSVELQGEVDDAVRPEDGSEVTNYVTILTARIGYHATSAGA